MNMLYMLEDYRGKGYGKQLVGFWEKEMLKNGYKMVMTSTLSNEDAQFFYRKNGYVDCGSLLLPKEPLEIIMLKNLIEKEGLKPMSRLYVHLSKDIETALKVGKRHGEPVVLKVCSGNMYQNGHQFFLSENGVWLTKKVDGQYSTGILCPWFARIKVLS